MIITQFDNILILNYDIQNIFWRIHVFNLFLTQLLCLITKFSFVSNEIFLNRNKGSNLKIPLFVLRGVGGNKFVIFG